MLALRCYTNTTDDAGAGRVFDERGGGVALEMRCVVVVNVVVVGARFLALALARKSLSLTMTRLDQFARFSRERERYVHIDEMCAAIDSIGGALALSRIYSSLNRVAIC